MNRKEELIQQLLETAEALDESAGRNGEFDRYLTERIKTLQKKKDKIDKPLNKLDKLTHGATKPATTLLKIPSYFAYGHDLNSAKQTKDHYNSKKAHFEEEIKKHKKEIDDNKNDSVVGLGGYKYDKERIKILRQSARDYGRGSLVGEDLNSAKRHGFKNEHEWDIPKEIHAKINNKAEDKTEKSITPKKEELKKIDHKVLPMKRSAYNESINELLSEASALLENNDTEVLK